MVPRWEWMGLGGNRGPGGGSGGERGHGDGGGKVRSVCVPPPGLEEGAGSWVKLC